MAQEPGEEQGGRRNCGSMNRTQGRVETDEVNFGINSNVPRARRLGCCHGRHELSLPIVVGATRRCKALQGKLHLSLCTFLFVLWRERVWVVFARAKAWSRELVYDVLQPGLRGRVFTGLLGRQPSHEQRRRMRAFGDLRPCLFFSKSFSAGAEPMMIPAPSSSIMSAVGSRIPEGDDGFELELRAVVS
jgi:hypothetical protein